MKYFIFAFFFLPLCLFAAVNLGDDYIGSTDMGEWRKTSRIEQYNDGGASSYGYRYYYYFNEIIPTRLDSVRSSTDGEFGGTSIDRYFYNYYPDYAETFIETWTRGYDDDDYAISKTTSLRYNQSGQLIEKIIHRFPQGPIYNRFYSYDAAQNLINITEFSSSYSSELPYIVENFNYDAQNRLVYKDLWKENFLQDELFQTWGIHAVPDSTFSIHNYVSGNYQIDIVSNEFDNNDNIWHVVKYEKSTSSGWWFKADQTNYFVYAHSIWFFTQSDIIISSANSLEDIFVEGSSRTISYVYTNDYHTATVSEYPSAYTRYDYNDNWLLTTIFANSVWRHIDQTWDFYGSTLLDDELVPTARDLTAIPNPFKDELRIRLAQPNKGTETLLKVYDLRGRQIRSLRVPKGATDLIWDGKDDVLRQCSSGIYLICLQVDGKRGRALKATMIR